MEKEQTENFNRSLELIRDEKEGHLSTLIDLLLSQLQPCKLLEENEILTIQAHVNNLKNIILNA